MKKKFDCWNCQKRFSAEDDGKVICPHCQSENVDYASFHLSKRIVRLLCGLLILIAVGLLFFNIDWNTFSKKMSSSEITDSVEKVAFVEDSTFIAETGMDIPPTLSVSELTFTEEGYAFEVIVEHVPNIPYVFVLLDEFKDVEIARNEDGKFEQIPCSAAPGGMYRVQLRDVARDSVLTILEVPGFIQQKKVTTKMSVSKLQSLIDSRDESLMGLGENDYLSPNYSLIFSGLSADAVNVPTIIAEIFNKLDMGSWESVKVQKIEYDDLNRIHKIHVQVVEENWDF